MARNKKTDCLLFFRVIRIFFVVKKEFPSEEKV